MKSKNSVSPFRIIWIIFLVFIALMIVYFYRLQTEGLLIKKLLNITQSIMNFMEKNPQIFIVLLTYIPIFYIGYVAGKRQVGRKRK